MKRLYHAIYTINKVTNDGYRYKEYIEANVYAYDKREAKKTVENLIPNLNKITSIMPIYRTDSYYERFMTNYPFLNDCEG